MGTHVKNYWRPRQAAADAIAAAFQPPVRPWNWRDDALCADADPEAWFPEEDNGAPTEARRICAMCPVRAECLEFAMDNHRIASYGIWAGTSEYARRRLRRERKRAA